MNDFIKNEYPVIKVLVDDFGYASGGEVIARHRIYGYKQNGSFGFAFQSSDSRQQTGGGEQTSEYATIALQLAGFGGYRFSHTEGSRSGGALFIVYKNPTQAG